MVQLETFFPIAMVLKEPSRTGMGRYGLKKDFYKDKHVTTNYRDSRWRILL